VLWALKNNNILAIFFGCYLLFSVFTTPFVSKMNHFGCLEPVFLSALIVSKIAYIMGMFLLRRLQTVNWRYWRICPQGFGFSTYPSSQAETPKLRSRSQKLLGEIAVQSTKKWIYENCMMIWWSTSGIIILVLIWDGNGLWWFLNMVTLLFPGPIIFFACFYEGQSNELLIRTPPKVSHCDDHTFLTHKNNGVTFVTNKYWDL